MDIKAYIDHFNDISHLKREQQFLLLKEASDDASSQLKFLNFATIAVVIRLFSLLIFVGGSYFIFGYVAWILIVTVLLGLLISRVAVTEINTYLLSKSLKNILKKNSEQQAN